MLRNFVNDEYLEKYFPDIVNYRKGGQVDYSGSISTAFELVMEDVIGRGLHPRRCMVALDLVRDEDASDNIQQLTSATISATTNYDAWEGDKQLRFVVNLTSKTVLTDDWSFILQGSNKATEPDDVDSTWETVKTIQYDTNTAAGDIVEETETFVTMYLWYRLRVVKNSGSGSVTFTASLYETAFDSLIAYRTLDIIARTYQTGLAEKWDVIKEQMKQEYEDRLASIKISYDSNDDGIPETTEGGVSVGGRIGSIGLSA